MTSRYRRALQHHDAVYQELAKSMPDSADVSTVSAPRPVLRPLRHKKREPVSKGVFKPLKAAWNSRAGKKVRNTAIAATALGGSGYIGYKVVGQPAVNAKRDLGMVPPDRFGKGDVEGVDAQMEFSKVAPEKRQVFGWASITHRNGKPIIDRQGDYIDLEEVEKSAYNYVVGSRVGGRQHRRTDEGAPFHAADMIESMVVTPDKREALGISSDAPQGWWVGFKVNDDDTWDAVKRGDVTGFSIHGRGKRADFEGFVSPEGVGNVDT